MMKNWIWVALFACSCFAAGCGSQSPTVVADPNEIDKYTTPVDAQAQMQKAQAEAATKAPR